MILSFYNNSMSKWSWMHSYSILLHSSGVNKMTENEMQLFQVYKCRYELWLHSFNQIKPWSSVVWYNIKPHMIATLPGK